jgi:hypothetical protein
LLTLLAFLVALLALTEAACHLDPAQGFNVREQQTKGRVMSMIKQVYGTGALNEAAALKWAHEIITCTNVSLLQGQLDELLNGTTGALQAVTNTDESSRCGYVFRRNDIAYNCRTCEADSTCVQCEAW